MSYIRKKIRQVLTSAKLWLHRINPFSSMKRVDRVMWKEITDVPKIVMAQNTLQAIADSVTGYVRDPVPVK